MTATVVLYDPTAPRFEAKDEVALPRLPTLAGAVVGFIDNAKPNFNHLVDDIAEVLVSRYRVARVLKRRKRAASVAVPGDVLDDLVRECDFIVTGSGD